MSRFKKFGRLVSEHPKRTIAAILILTVVFAGFATTVEEEMSISGFFPQYPEVEAMNKIQGDFGNEEGAMILLEGENVLTPQSFRQTADIMGKIWENRSIHSALIEPKKESISSLPTILAYYRLSQKGNRSPTTGEVLNEIKSFSSENKIKTFLKSFLASSKVPKYMKSRALFYLPKNFERTDMEPNKMVIYVSLNASLPKENLKDVELKIKSVSESVEGPNKVSVYGFSLIDHYYKKTMTKLMPMFLVAIILVIIIMAINFRRASDVGISLSTLFLAIIWIIGFAGIVGWKIDIMGEMVPILILGLGIDFSFHSLTGYREGLGKSGGKPKKAARYALATVGVALTLAAITTIVGFSSNGISAIPSIRHFGYLSGFGIFSIFILNVTYTPALRESLDRRKDDRELAGSWDESEITENRIIENLARLIKRPYAPKLLLLLIGMVAVSGLAVGFTMKASYDPTGELSQDFEITHAYNTLNEDFSLGTETAYIRVNGNLTSPTFWKEVRGAIERMVGDNYVVTYEGEPKTESILSVMPMLLKENPSLRKAYSKIDRDMDGKIDEDVSSDPLREFLNKIYSTKVAKYFIHKNENGNFDSLLIRVSTDTKMGYHGKELQKELQNDFENVGENVVIAGQPIIWAKGMNDMRDSMTNSVILCLIVAFAILPIVFALFHQSPRLGLLTVVTPLLVIGLLFMTMKLLSIPLNSMTAMVGAIIIGIGIDYPIHIANRWALERENDHSPENCYRISLGSAGKEVFYSSLTTMVAFAVFLILDMPVIVQFGLAIVLGLFYSLLGAVVILPFLLRLFWHKGD